ncbi:nuclear distribution protein nudE homolog 1-like [Bubalus bubalis]|uniref:nuclear distribution protein nudE homolog 1-like n=1 Tax=Bubalus bubalis TaxID=89462 RepID=UPI001E1B6A3A|nr:nuclear distribution protein nudE homolog 1-like [Bubalus bubalis]
MVPTSRDSRADPTGDGGEQASPRTPKPRHPCPTARETAKYRHSTPASCSLQTRVPEREPPALWSRAAGSRLAQGGLGALPAHKPPEIPAARGADPEGPLKGLRSKQDPGARHPAATPPRPVGLLTHLYQHRGPTGPCGQATLRKRSSEKLRPDLGPELREQVPPPTSRPEGLHSHSGWGLASRSGPDAKSALTSTALASPGHRDIWALPWTACASWPVHRPLGSGSGPNPHAAPSLGDPEVTQKSLEEDSGRGQLSPGGGEFAGVPTAVHTRAPSLPAEG